MFCRTTIILKRCKLSIKTQIFLLDVYKIRLPRPELKAMKGADIFLFFSVNFISNEHCHFWSQFLSIQWRKIRNISTKFEIGVIYFNFISNPGQWQTENCFQYSREDRREVDYTCEKFTHFAITTNPDQTFHGYWNLKILESKFRNCIQFNGPRILRF